MTNWATLTHAYGSAADIPAMLDAVTPEPHTEAWNDLWSAVCHQGSVYSASAAVLPQLRAMAQQWAPGDRLAPLVLAGAIVASRDPSPDFDIAPFRADVDALAMLAMDAITAARWSRVDFIYLLQAAMGLQGHALWGGQLDRLADGEFHAVCNACDAELQVAIGEYGYFVTDEEWLDRPDTPRHAIEAAEAASLTGIGARLHGLAHDADQPAVAHDLRHLFGHATCPACSQRLSIADAIAKGDE